MSTLHVRNVPPEIYEALRRRAEQRDSSISTETIRLLVRALRTDRDDVLALLDQIERKRPTAAQEAPSAAELIRGDRDQR